MILENEYIDGNRFESIADLGFGDKYTKELPLDINRLTTFLSNFKENRLPINTVKYLITLITPIILKINYYTLILILILIKTKGGG